MSLAKKYERLRIRLQVIKDATNNFGTSNCIGRGGFGSVYKGELTHCGRHVMVAVKRLDPKYQQGGPEFWQEIIVLSHYKHENIVSLLGFSDEGSEKILVYEYLSDGSLDKYLSNPYLSWTDRLNICIGAARGLEHLHNPHRTKQRVVHRDIKSSNILLDNNLNAKISDFGLSNIVPANKEFPFIISQAAGTNGYCDPLHADTGFLTKQVDIYSFGVVLFEVLCGRLCVEKNDSRPFLTELARSYFEKRKIRTIVFDCLQDQISRTSLAKFSAIAYKCLHRDPDEHPSASEIVKQLRYALGCQAGHDFWEEKRLNSNTIYPLVKNTSIYNSRFIRLSKKTGKRFTRRRSFIH